MHPVLAPIAPRLMLEITKKCNYACPYCYCEWHEYPEIALREMPISSWKRVIDAYAHKGGQAVMFTGGEPLLKRGFAELIEYAHKKTSLELAVFTNGSHIDETWLRLFKRCNINMGISLQGIQTYAKSTQTRRSFLKILEILLRARELKISLSISSTITQINQTEIESIVGAALAAEAQIISLIPFMFAGKGNSHPELALTWEEWRTLQERVIKQFGNDSRIVFGNEMVCNCTTFKGAPPPALKGQPKSRCRAGKDYAVIGPSGYLRRCLHTHENLMFWRDYLA